MCCSAICWQDKDCQEGNAPCPNDPILTTTRWDGAAPVLPFRSSPKLSCLGWHGFTAWFPKLCISFPLEPTTAERVMLWDRQCVCPRPWLALP